MFPRLTEQAYNPGVQAGDFGIIMNQYKPLFLGVQDGQGIRFSTNAITMGTNGGNVGIGTTTPAYKLDVSGDVRTNTNMYVNGYYYCMWGGVWSQLSGGPNGTATWSTSDQRLKKEIITIPNAMETLNKLNGVTWQWNDDGLQHLTRDIESKWRSVSGTPEDNRKLWDEKRKEALEKLSKTQMGFIAQEVEQVFPDWIQTDAQGYKQVDMSRLNAVLVNAVKEQQQTIETLKTALKTQQSCLDAQQKQIDELKVILMELKNKQKI